MMWEKRPTAFLNRHLAALRELVQLRVDVHGRVPTDPETDGWEFYAHESDMREIADIEQVLAGRAGPDEGREVL